MSNKFKTLQWEVEELGDIYAYLERRIEDAGVKFAKTGEQEQDKKWNSDTCKYDLLWEDEEQTIPKMKDKWDYIPIPEDERTEESKIKVALCKKLMDNLEKIIK